ncbi:S-adenosyl-L-methionine-dependent methyltransferase [Rhizodiscina lignyota]|uniref:S-adenosyl-L-methionine-dependent methyltransferase n=1 Tax=Rhizodiscina lignyota TaxID=1504668 RepID=A0A9P4I9C3_9PEZI|nr:S-adenosyl-L-methionine-dependent methyltransferase [Rhizodiscina lignyota]
MEGELIPKGPRLDWPRLNAYRRYHAYEDGMYHLPNDEIEADRLNLQHHEFRLTIGGKLHLAPLSKDIQEVLDVGCGTGITEKDFADEYPSSRVLGIDLSPIQPLEVPPNCSFLVDNVEAEWNYDHQFDYIHSRAMVAGTKNWPRFLQQAYDALKPGGIIELQDVVFPGRCDDGSAPPTSPMAEWFKLFIEAGTKAGLNPTQANDFATPLRQAGFVGITGRKFKWPLGPWAKGKMNKTLGKWTLENILEGLQGGSLALFTRMLGWSKERVEVFLMEVRRELHEQKSHFYMPM